MAAIGIRVQRWVAYHGLALNLCTDLDPFRFIVPCGISDRPVASVASLTDCTMQADQLMAEYVAAMLEAFEQVFDVNTAELPPEQRLVLEPLLTEQQT